MVQNIVVLGLQWGDEGKGKVVDYLVPKVQYVVRYQGGHNAGHTIIVTDDKKMTSHLVPSGILHDHSINIIASGVVVSPRSFVQELESLIISNISVNNRIFISERCALILPYHVAVDLAREKKSHADINNNRVIGTTGCGIGPVSEDKVARRALHISDLYDRDIFESKLKSVSDYYNFQLIHYYNEKPIDYKVVINEIMSISNRLIEMVIDVPKLLINSRKKGDKVIFEGAQGSLLDVDHGTYPYVTSSHVITGGVSIGTGIAPDYIDRTLGIIKAYSTRVGFGPFPTELLNDDTNNWLCTNGNEFGSTTGRRRRIGWFDAVAVRYSVQINSVYSCCLTKIDVLDGLKEIKICVAYQNPNGELIYDFPCVLEKLQHIIPVYEILPGWSKHTAGINQYDFLPKEAKYYIKRIEEIIGISIDIISTGPERSMMIMLRDPLNE